MVTAASQPVSSRVYLVSGSDAAARRRVAAELVHRHAGDNPDPFGLDVVRQSGEQTVAEVLGRLVESIRSPSFMGGEKTVWLRDFDGFDKEGARTDKSPEAVAFRELARRIAEGLPDDVTVIMDGVGVDRRKGLYKACKERGEIVWKDKPDPKDRGWERHMQSAVAETLEARGLRMKTKAHAAFVSAMGADTERIGTELDKLTAYVDDPAVPIPLEAVQAVTCAAADASPFALLNAIGQRSLPQAMAAIDILLAKETRPEGAAFAFVLQAWRKFRELLQVRALMHARKWRTERAAVAGIQAMGADETKRLIDEGLAFVGYSAGRLRFLVPEALRYQGPELVEAVKGCRDANLACVTSQIDARALLEKLLVDTLGGGRAGRR